MTPSLGDIGPTYSFWSAQTAMYIHVYEYSGIWCFIFHFGSVSTPPCACSADPWGIQAVWADLEHVSNIWERYLQVGGRWFAPSHFFHHTPLFPPLLLLCWAYKSSAPNAPLSSPPSWLRTHWKSSAASWKRPSEPTAVTGGDREIKFHCCAYQQYLIVPVLRCVCLCVCRCVCVCLPQT